MNRRNSVEGVENIFLRRGQRGERQGCGAAFEMKISDLAEGVESALHGVAAKCAVDVQVYKARGEKPTAQVHTFAFGLGCGGGILGNLLDAAIADSQRTVFDCVGQDQPGVSNFHGRMMQSALGRRKSLRQNPF